MRLKATIGVWFAAMIAVFLFMQWLRVQEYQAVMSLIANPANLFSSIHYTVNVFAVALVLLCELIVVAQWMIYLKTAWVGAMRYHLNEKLPLPEQAPPVLVLVPSCNEDPTILRRSLSSVRLLRYPNVRIVLVENSRTESYKAQSVMLAERYGVEVLHVVNRGHKAGALNDALKAIGSGFKYVAVVDADQRIAPAFLEDLVPLLEADSRLAFAQAPQLYENAEATWLTRAAAQQETLLYDTIQEGKSVNGRALCCGTHFLMRREALDDVGGWDESSLSEDLATSFRLHWLGWRSVYVRRSYGAGLGPLNLPAYWKQQQRWAEGNTTVFRRVLATLFTSKPSRQKLAVAIDYLWSSGFYITTLTLACLATAPMLMLLEAQISSAPSTQGWIYLSVYPLYAAVMLFPYVHMRLRGYPVRNLLQVQGLLAITMPTYVTCVLKGLLRNRTFFEIAPKSILDRKLLWWRSGQTYLFLLLMVTGSLLTKAVFTHWWSPPVWIAIFWTLIYSVSLGHFFIYWSESKRILKRRANKTRKDAIRREPLAEPWSLVSDLNASQIKAQP
jgi:cellulose synthase (UDP-forming)